MERQRRYRQGQMWPSRHRSEQLLYPAGPYKVVALATAALKIAAITGRPRYICRRMQTLLNLFADLFDALVVLFTSGSQWLGLSYAELNSIVYCGLVPLGWLGLVVVRQPRYKWLLLAGTVALVVLTLALRRPGSTGQGFYNHNIRVLELLGRATGLGYVLVSLLMGVLIPAVAAGLLLLAPRRRALLAWVGLLALLLGYFLLGTRLA